MRTIHFVLLLLIFSAPAKAQISSQRNTITILQSPLSAGSNEQINDAGKKWFVSKYMGFYNSVHFFNDGNAIFLGTSVGLQVNRKLNNNWYAFTSISTTPAFIGFNHSFMLANTNKFMQANSLFSPSNFNMNPRAELGLMFINDQKTFSISGSISIEKTNYFNMPFNQLGVSRPNTYNTSKR